MPTAFGQREMIVKTIKKIYVLLFVLGFINWTGGNAQGCPACWAGYGSGDERFNKPLADLRILFEKEGKAALPAFREALRTQEDPLVKQRAAAYLAEFKDTESIPLLEKEILEIVKRVSFSKFGLGLPEFQTRLKIAHILASLGYTRVADRLWEKYEQLDLLKKMEIPYLLNALNDPKLTDRLMYILDKGDDHQLMLGAIEVLGIGGNSKALPFLKFKISEWEKKKEEIINLSHHPTSAIYYSVLKIKAAQAISHIEERYKSFPNQK